MYASNPAVQQQLAGLTHHFQMRGSDVHTAGAQALENFIASSLAKRTY